MPMRGLVNITYYSGEGAGKKDCKPYVAFRKALLNLVLINEDEIVEESLRARPPPAVSIGDRAFQRHLRTSRAPVPASLCVCVSHCVSVRVELWESYLAPEFIDPNRKR